MIAPEPVLAGLDAPATVPPFVCFSGIDDTGIRTVAVTTSTHQRCCCACGTTEAAIRPLVGLRATVDLCEPCAWEWIAQERQKGVA